MTCIPKPDTLEVGLGVPVIRAREDDSAAVDLAQEIIVNNPVLDLVVVTDPLDLAVTEVNFNLLPIE